MPELPPFGQQMLDAVGLSICEDVVSPINLPRFDNSAMDGYAVRAAGRGRTPRPDARSACPWSVRSRPASPPRTGCSPGTAMKIMTGAPVPADADAIVPYETTDRGVSDVRVFAASVVGQHIRRIGEDVQAGDQLISRGHQLGVARHRGAGRHRPGQGDGAAPAPGGGDRHRLGAGRPRPRLDSEEQIYDSNSYLLAAAARAAGAQVFRVGHVGDDPAAVKQLINDQLVRADLILTTGGVSQGDYDIVKAVMPELGACDFVAVAMQPGKPQGFGLIGDDRVPMIMLPGNPVSAFVSFEAFVRPVIRKLMGATPHARAAGQLPATARHRLDPRPPAAGPRDRHRGSSADEPAGRDWPAGTAPPAGRPGPRQRPGDLARGDRVCVAAGPTGRGLAARRGAGAEGPR